MLLMLKMFLGKHLKPILWGVLALMIVGGIYVAFKETIKEGNKQATKAGAATERLEANEKVIEDVQKANRNATAPTSVDRQRRLCEKYDRNRTDCK